jgi:hypothetical protein
VITHYEDISKATFSRITIKTLDHLFLSRVERGANCPPFVSNAILEIAKSVYNLQSSTKSGEQLKPGQYRIIGILSSEPAGKALKDCCKGQCTITLDAGKEDLQVRHQHGIPALRRARLLRICSEACEQDIHLSQEDIAYNILNCSVRTVVRDVDHWRKKGIFVPTRGQQKDIGPGLSHKVVAIKLLIERKHPVDIARILYHSLQSIERYTECFARVISLHRQGLSHSEIAFVVQISERLVNQYLALYEQYNTPEYRKRLQEIIHKPRAGVTLSKDPGSSKKKQRKLK